MGLTKKALTNRCTRSSEAAHQAWSNSNARWQHGRVNRSSKDCWHLVKCSIGPSNLRVAAGLALALLAPRPLTANVSQADFRESSEYS